MKNKVSYQHLIWILTGALLLLSTSCKTPPPVIPDAADQKPIGDLLKIGTDMDSKIESTVIRTTTPDGAMHSEETEPNTLQWPTRNLTKKPVGVPSLPYDFSMDMVKDDADPNEVLEVNIKLDGEDLQDLIKQMALILEFEYYLDPAVSGSVTFELEGEMTRMQVWELFARILWFNDAYITRDAGFIRIMQMEKMAREQRLFSKESPRVNVAVELVRFTNTKASDMVSLITPYLSPKASVTPIPHLNALMVIDTPANTEKLQELVARLDKLGTNDWPQDSIPCSYVDSKVIVEELNQILPILGFRTSSGDKADDQSIRISPIERMQVIVVAAPIPEMINEVRRWVHVLDSPNSGEREQIYFYNVKHRKAEDLADAVDFFFTSSSSAGSSGGSSSSSSDSDSGENASEDSPRLTRRENRRRTSSSSDSGNGENKLNELVFDVPVSTYVDGLNNRLVVRTTPRAYKTLLALLESMDIPPLQVLIQMTIAEIQLTDETSFGFKFNALEEFQSGEYELETGFDFDGNGTAKAPGLNLILSKIGDPTQIFYAISAAAGEGNTRVLFSPQVIGVSDEEALINVGDKVPIVTQENNSDDSTNISREIQYQDTGIIMQVTPHITANRMVTLKIRQEVSDAVQTTSSNIDSPTIQSRIVESTFNLEDNSTVLLGGLIRTRDRVSNTGIPLLRDIPLLGAIFRQKETENTRSELLLLMTVNVIDMDSNLEILTRRYNAALDLMREKLSAEAGQEFRSRGMRKQ